MIECRVLPPTYHPVPVAGWLDLLDGSGLGNRARGARVLLKPNFCGSWLPSCTHPALVGATAAWLRDCAAGQVTVGEASVIGVDTAGVFESLGVRDALRGTGAGLVDLSRGPYVWLDVPGGATLRRIRVARAALEADLIISFAKLKTVRATTVSLTIKNLKGLPAPEEKRRFHHLGVHQCVTDLLRGLGSRCFGLVDGVHGLDLAEPKPVGLGVAGSDLVAVDAAASAAIGIDPRRVPHLALADAFGLGRLDEGRAAAGTAVETLGLRVRPFLGPAAMASDLPVPVGSEVVVGQACTGCLAILSSVLRDMKGDGTFPTALARTVIAVGTGVKVGAAALAGRRLVLVGNCAPAGAARGGRLPADWAKAPGDTVWARGCPPHSKLDLRAALESRTG